jgi:hypothetical protein
VGPRGLRTAHAPESTDRADDLRAAPRPPLRLSDVASRDEFRALEIYRELYGPLGLEHQIAFTLPQGPPRLLGVALSRRDRDFSDAERDLLGRARPFLIQGYATRWPSRPSGRMGRRR